MTDYEQLQSVFTALGLPHKAITIPGACYQPYSSIDIDGVEFWFNSRGDFLQVYYWQYDDHLKVERLGNTSLLWEDDVVATNLARAEREDAVQRQTISEERMRRVSALAQQRAEYRARYPLQYSTYSEMVFRAHGILQRGEARTFEQAVDKIAQDDPEWFDLVVQASRNVLCSS